MYKTINTHLTMSLRRAGSRFVKNWKTNGTGDFYSCVKWPLLSYRYFCLFPVCLKESNDENSLSFRWTSPYIIFVNTPTLILQAVLAGFYIWNTCVSGIEFPSISLTLNYTFGFISSIYMLKLAKNFKHMFKKVLSIERNLPTIKNNSNAVLFLPAIVVMGCIGSFFHCTLNSMYLYHIAINCSPLNDDSLLKTYFNHIFQTVFKYVEFSYIAAVIFQIVKFHNMLIPTLNDVLIIACSVYLENRFNNLNYIITLEQKKYNGAVYMDWRKIQDHYVQLTKLAKVIDKRINPIVFNVFFIDLYNLCLQFYYVVNKRNNHTFINNNTGCVAIHSVDLHAKFYKPYMAFFMLCKMVAVSLLCSRLHTSSRETLKGLHTIPQAAYNHDTHRFMEQVYHSNIALSGFEFFYITKEMIITVLRIVVTYELVLLQFK